MKLVNAVGQCIGQNEIRTGSSLRVRDELREELGALATFNINGVQLRPTVLPSELRQIDGLIKGY